jgi:hypothetical protein
MDRKSQVSKSKEDRRREENKPGVIVAGPQAHARERAGKAPVGRKPKSGEEHSKHPDNPS